MEGVHQRFHSYVVWYVDFRDDIFKFLHEIPQALSISMVEIPEIRGGGFLTSKHDIILKESRREVVKTADGVLLEAGEPVESDPF